MGTNGSKTNGGGAQVGVLEKTHLVDAVREHSASVNCMALSEDGSVLATGSDDRTVRLWSARTKRCDCIGILSGHKGYITTVCIEAVYVVSGSADSTLRKWDIATCTCMVTFSGHDGRINRVVCTGEFLFSSSIDRTIRCWDFESGVCIREFAGHSNSVFPLIFVPYEDNEDAEGLNNLSDEKKDPSDRKNNPIFSDLIISGSTDCTARSWSFETGRTLKIFKGHTGPVSCLATDADGRILYTGSTDFSLRSWMIETGAAMRVYEEHEASIICMTVVEKTVYTASSDSTVRAWPRDRNDSSLIMKGHQESILCIRYYDGFILTGSGDGTVMCFDAETGEVKRVFKGPPYAIVNALQIVETRMITAATDGTLRVWNLRGLKDVDDVQINMYDNNYNNNYNSKIRP